MRSARAVVCPDWDIPTRQGCFRRSDPEQGRGVKILTTMASWARAQCPRSIKAHWPRRDGSVLPSRMPVACVCTVPVTPDLRSIVPSVPGAGDKGRY